MDQRGTRFHTDLQALEEHRLLADGCIVAADNVLKPGAPHFLWYLQTSQNFDLVVVSLREFAADKIEDWMSVARHRAHGPPERVEFPDTLGELAFLTDRQRQKSCAGDRPGEVDEDAWAAHSQDLSLRYKAAGIDPPIVHVYRREDGTPFVEWSESGQYGFWDQCVSKRNWT